MQCGVEIGANVCMYVKMSCYWAPHVNYAYEPPGQSATRVCTVLHTFLTLKSSETADGRVIGRRELPANRRRMYVAPTAIIFLQRLNCLLRG